MVIKIRNKGKSKDTAQYKSSKQILTPQDIKEADRFDATLSKAMKEIERILLKEKMLTSEARKHDVLKVWYLIGSRINKFLRENRVSIEEEKIFWDHLYGRSSLINKTVPKGNIGKARNDFKTASLLAQRPLKKLEKIGSWALWREIITYKAFQDERVLNWILKKLEQSFSGTRDEARPFLKAVSARLKKIDTTVLSNKELIIKLDEVVK